jgi:outer membrane protein assembly factor BamB
LDARRCRDEAWRARRARRVLPIIGLAAAAFAFPVGALAQDAGGWSQYQGDAGHAGAATALAAPPYTVAWESPFELGGPNLQNGLSAPVLADDLAIAVGPTEVVAVGLSDGQETWSARRDPGPSVAPALASVDGATVVVFTEGHGDNPPVPTASPATEAPSTPATPSPSPSDGGDEETAPADSHIAAIAVGERRRSWTVQLDAVSRTGVTVEGDTAYVGDSRGEITAIDVATGDVRWQQSVEGYVARPVAVADGTVVVTIQGSRSVTARVIALDAADGTERWRFDPGGRAILTAAPAIGGDLVVVPFIDSTVRALSLSDGTERWSVRLNSLIGPAGGSAVSADAVVVVDLTGEIYRLDPETGERVWDFALNERTLRSAPIVGPDHVLVATDRGRLVAVELTTGELVWKSGTGPLLRSLAADGDRVLAVRGGADAGLVAFENDPGGVLVREISPTVIDLPMLFGSMLAAGIPFALIVVLLGRGWLRRLGPAFPDGDASELPPEEEDE